MADGATTEAARFCIRANAITATACGFGPYLRVIPSNAIELASVYLDRHVIAVLARADNYRKPTAETGSRNPHRSVRRRPRHRFRPPPVSNDGRRTLMRHLVAPYVSKINAMKRQFPRLAADGENRAQPPGAVD